MRSKINKKKAREVDGNEGKVMNGEETGMEQDEIKIGTWNVRSSMGKEERNDKLRYYRYILGITETKNKKREDEGLRK